MVCVCVQRAGGEGCDAELRHQETQVSDASFPAAFALSAVAVLLCVSCVLLCVRLNWLRITALTHCCPLVSFTASIALLMWNDWLSVVSPQAEHGDGDVGGGGDDPLARGVFLGRGEVHPAEAGHV